MLVSLKRARRTFAASALVMLGLMSSMPQIFAADFKMGVIDPQVILEKTKAGKRAFIDAVQKARPILLEPFVHLEVTVPSNYMGDIASDLSTKRGRVEDTEMIGSDTVIVKARAPLSELQNYSNQLKSMTAGAGSYTMDYSHAEQTPPNIQATVIAEFKGHHEED